MVASSSVNDSTSIPYYLDVNAITSAERDIDEAFFANMENFSYDALDRMLDQLERLPEGDPAMSPFSSSRQMGKILTHYYLDLLDNQIFLR